jgi:hypothetical protein
MDHSVPRSALNKIVLVAALGYFVDIYDLVLFGMERVASLQDILLPLYPEKAERDAMVACVGGTFVCF